MGSSLVQYLKNSQCNSCKQAKEEKSPGHINQCRQSIWQNPIAVHNQNSQK